MPSIRQNTYPDLLPDFRNLAVMARVLVGVNALALAGTFYAAPAVAPAVDRFIHAAAFLEPLLLIELMVLFAASGLIARLPYWLAGARRGAPAGAAGAHPAALPVQQPECGAGAHPARSETRRARARGYRRPFPHADVRRAPVRAPRRRNRAPRALRRHRAAAPGRSAARH